MGKKWREEERDCEGFGGKNRVRVLNLISAAGFHRREESSKMKKVIFLFFFFFFFFNYKNIPKAAGRGIHRSSSASRYSSLYYRGSRQLSILFCLKN